MSSSLYPPSTSTASGTASPPSPKSLQLPDDHLSSPFVSEANEAQEYDSDDVAYRLRLLVKNNYFLPPAHSKPSAHDLGTTLNPPAKPTRSTTPTFLDIFRIGKTKPKSATPPTPVSPFDPTLPMLRTASDSVTSPYAFRGQQTRPTAQLPRLSPQPSQPPPSRGRVVVVREKVNDIAVAAKQAEQDLKSKAAARNDQGSQHAKPELNDIIDPTDAVDIPLPSPSYPFAVQTSALHGLGVLDSLGADVLADHLPPPNSPSANFDPVEDSWRKALLHQAVHHSLDNTPDASTMSHFLGATSPTPSTRIQSPEVPSRNQTPNQQKVIGQRILSKPMLEAIEIRPQGHARQVSAHSQASTSKSSVKPAPAAPLAAPLDDSRPSSYFPARVDTPCEPMTPLAPPPRRAFGNGSYSQSQTQLVSTSPTTSDTPASSPTSDSQPRVLRRTVSSPSLADSHDLLMSRYELMTPPPVPTETMYSRRSGMVLSFDSMRNSYDAPHGMGSEYDGEPRQSFASSAMGMTSRPSLSDYSQPSLSPTTSAFEHMLNSDDHSGTFGRVSASGEQYPPPFRYSAMSPPPRVSSSLAHVTPLGPPPRANTGHYNTVAATSRGSSETHRRIDIAKAQEHAPRIVNEPPTPVSGRRAATAPSRTLTTPVTSFPTLHSPGPASPTSFFDTIQSQPNAMDDLESSDEEDEQPALPPPPKIFADPRTRTISNVSHTSPPRSPLMRLGNFSAPYLRGEPSRSQPQIGSGIASKQPISNIPGRGPVSSDGRKGSLPPSSYDFFKYAQEQQPSKLADLSASGSSPRPSTAEQVSSWRDKQQAQESLRKLDGMLLHHMEVEKETISKIASTLKKTSAAQAQGPLSGSSKT